jgi:TonB family protein
MANVYPELANDLGLGGFARINCRINSLGLVESCHVLSQTPPAMGFGRAALRLAPMFRFRPATGLAGAIPSYVVIPVRFVPPPDDIRRAIPVMALLAAIATFAARRKRALTAKEEIGETGSIQA